VTSIGPGPESVELQLYAPSPNAARWDRSTWDGGLWTFSAWQTVACDVVEASYVGGVTDEAGVLSQSGAGPMDLSTLDPNRELDPSNASSPFFGSVAPGTPVKLRGGAAGAMVDVWNGWIDEATHDIATQRGRVRCINAIALLAQAEVPDATVLPNTLRARTRAVIAAVGLSRSIELYAESTDPDALPDPAVAPHDGKAAAAWTIIQNAALDALTLVWIAPDGIVRFTSWGALPDAVVSLGCAPAGDGGTWIGGLSTIEYGVTAAAVRNRVRAWSATDVWTAYQDDGESIARYGARPLDVDRVVPGFAAWSARILADRADAGLSVTLGEVRPYTIAELNALLAIAQTGPQVIRVYDDEHGAVIDDSVAIVGRTGRVTPAGWSFRYVTSIPRVEWDAVEPPPPIVPPVIPPPDPYHTETRTYVATSDALLALTSGGSKYGAGAATSLPVGTWSGWTYRACIQLPAIPWTKVRRIVSAKLRVRTSTQVRIGFGSSPTIEVQRITGSWSAGSSSSPSSGNAVVYPGPATTTAGAKRQNITTAQSTDQDIDITAIATAWAPAAIAGSGAAQRGVMLLPGSGSGADTTEVWPVEQGGAARPSLILVVEVFD
jgi:hypothetical protein